MPVVYRFGPYRFYFHSDENQKIHEPPHVHVQSGNGAAIFWLDPVGLRRSWAYTPREIARIQRVVVGSRDLMLRRWHEYFDQLT